MTDKFDPQARPVSATAPTGMVFDADVQRQAVNALERIAKALEEMNKRSATKEAVAAFPNGMR